ncbi:SFT2-domain-containing protein [Fragilariopsis cylindrus CCMP1102]|uniref:Vesicle transport protein n=1 Tax=Fragilariopsis cylindrus CCMP1102 TaxID=635003 RepID=A0A1E7F7A9_9STRA|nr:SFT2-domain-containing protein [Fragilariopsis cylindrus CCMP1102]|eukprot:OEU14061.1 SFT2-domain-containing protein [Fragilariopsis cylindrus CCMP1102]
MVGLNGSNSGDVLNINNENDDIELAASNNSKNGESDSERTTTFVEEAADLLCPELTFQQRLLGFATCFTIAYMITFMSFKFFVQLIEGYPVPFAINYSAGNLLAMSASGFLCGPKRQFRNMFDEKRRTVSIVYLSCLFSTLVVVFIPIYWPAKLTILITLVITQCSANIWYSLSYVPYGRRTALKLMKRYLGLNGNGGGSAEGSGFMGLGGSGELS